MYLVWPYSNYKYRNLTKNFPCSPPTLYRNIKINWKSVNNQIKYILTERTQLTRICSTLFLAEYLFVVTHFAGFLRKKPSIVIKTIWSKNQVYKTFQILKKELPFRHNKTTREKVFLWCSYKRNTFRGRMPEVYLGPYKTSMIKRFCESSKWLWALNYFRKKAPS